MSSVTVSSKGQVVLPARVRKRLGLGAGSRLELVEEEDGVRLVVARPVVEARLSEVVGMVQAPSKGQPRRLAEFDAAALTRRRR